MCDRSPAGVKRWLLLLVTAGCVWGGMHPSLPARQAVQEPAAGSPAPDPTVDLLNIDLQADVRLFVVMAALNAAGFDYEVPGKEIAPLRARLRKDLEGLDPELKRRLRIHLELHRRGDPRAVHTAYTSLALLIEGPPDFKVRSDAPTLPWDVQEILGFEELLPDFYRRAGLAQLWELYRPHYEAELEAYRPVIRQAIQGALDYLRIPPRVVLDRRIVIMADLLSYRDVVHARNLEKTYYVVLGPAESPASNLLQVQHEYLHFLVDPLVEKHAGQIMKERASLELAERQPGLPRDFRGRFLLVVGESVIEAILHRLHPPADLNAETVELFRRGLVYFPYFWRGLEQYEKTEGVALPLYLEQLFTQMGRAEPEKEAERVASLEAQLEAARRAAEEAQAREQAASERRGEVRRLLAEAGEHLVAGRHESARLVLNRLLELDPGNGNAEFYLAQVAAQTGDHQTAALHYARAEAAADVPDWVRAWSAVRIGRFLAHQGDFGRAREKLEAVARMTGELRGAREEAEKSLAQLPPPE